MNEAELSRIVKREYNQRYDAKHPGKTLACKKRYLKSEIGKEKRKEINRRYRESCKMA